MTVRRAPRVAAVVGLALPLAVAVLVGVDASPALAGGAFTSPDAGRIVTSDTTVPVRAQLGPITRTTELHLRGPDGADHVVATAQSVAGGDTLGFDFATACPSYPGADPCSGRHPAAAGTWTAYLTGGASAQRTFEVRIPPASPTDVSAAPAGRTTARISWARGAEPDLTGYDVTTPDGNVLVAGIAVGDACNDTSCSADLDFGRAAAGRHDVAVVAHRSCDGCPNPDLASPPSEPATVTLVGPTEPPSPAGPSASASPAGPGASAPSDGGGGRAATSNGRRRAFDAAVGGARLGAAALPSLPQAAEVTRIPAPYGTYSPRLGYHVRARGAVPAPQVAAAPSVVTSLRDSVSSVADRRPVWQALAAALLLVVVALHVRRWATATRRG